MRADSTATWPLPNTSSTGDTANERQDVRFSGEWPRAALPAATAEARRQDVPSSTSDSDSRCPWKLPFGLPRQCPCTQLTPGCGWQTCFLWVTLLCHLRIAPGRPHPVLGRLCTLAGQLDFECSLSAQRFFFSSCGMFSDCLALPLLIVCNTNIMACLY